MRKTSTNRVQMRPGINKYSNKLLFLFFIILLIPFNVKTSDVTATEPPLLNLKWSQAYDDDTLDKSIIGLEWALSFVGAKLPSDGNGITSHHNIIEINIDKLGFEDRAKQKLSELHKKIKATDEYKKTNAIDLGRYVTLLLGAPEHYYEITNVPLHMNELLSNYTLVPQQGYVNNSGVSLKHRIISFSEPNGLSQLFLATEVDPVSGEVLEFETVEIIANGQLRFGIFDKDGMRQNNADPLNSIAGKPAKCMWCHESSILPLFSVQSNFDGYLTYPKLQETLMHYKAQQNALQYALTDGVDFRQKQQHTLTELLYISFMEPSAERLSLEWEIPLSEVLSKISGLPTHHHEEFSQLGEIYYRKDVEAFAPFVSLEVSSSVREKSEIEVNHIN